MTKDAQPGPGSTTTKVPNTADGESKSLIEPRVVTYADGTGLVYVRGRDQKVLVYMPIIRMAPEIQQALRCAPRAMSWSQFLQVVERGLTSIKSIGDDCDGSCNCASKDPPSAQE